jgi:hypothetical protein
VAISGISERDIGLRILTETNSAEEAGIERVEGVLALVEELVADVEDLDKVSR